MISDMDGIDGSNIRQAHGLNGMKNSGVVIYQAVQVKHSSRAPTLLTTYSGTHYPASAMGRTLHSSGNKSTSATYDLCSAMLNCDHFTLVFCSF
jgi:hypothetical protein